MAVAWRRLPKSTATAGVECCHGDLQAPVTHFKGYINATAGTSPLSPRKLRLSPSI